MEIREETQAVKLPKRKRLMYKILLSFTILIIVITVIMLFLAFIFSTRTVKNNSINFTSQLIQQVDTAINAYVTDTNSIFEVVSSNRGIKEYLSGGSGGTELSDTLNGIAMTKIDVLNIFVIAMQYGESGYTVRGLPVCNHKDAVMNAYMDYGNAPWYDSLFAENRESVLTSSYVQNLIYGKYNWVISMAKKVYAEDGTFRGVVLIDLKYNSFINLCENNMPKSLGYVYVVDDKNNIVYHPSQQLIYADLFKENLNIIRNLNHSYVEQDGNIYIATSSERSTWKTVGVLKTDSLMPNKWLMILVYVGSALAFMIAGFFISVILSKKITRPIEDLETGVECVQEGDFSTRVEGGSDEIGRLADAFNVMTVKIENLMQENQKNEAEKREQLLEALKAQINPHFLYNTLDSIIWMSEAGRNEDVIEMTNALASMLRSSIGKDHDKVSLEVEIANVKNYLKIQKYRYGDKLNYAMDIPKGLYKKKVEHLTLQPLVENAIYHGIRNKPEGGKIVISAVEEDGKLKISVTDDGLGMSPERIREVLHIPSAKKGIGISNVDSRIKLTFGKCYGLQIQSELNVGTTVTMELPSIDVNTEDTL